MDGDLHRGVSAPVAACSESNFPADKAGHSYAVGWNAMKRLAAGASAEEQDDLFWRTAARAYRLDISDIMRKGDTRSAHRQHRGNDMTSRNGHAYPKVGLLIDGDWITDRPSCMDIENPSDEAILGQVPRASADDLANALAAAQRGFEVWSRTPPLAAGGVPPPGCGDRARAGRGDRADLHA